jgi:hypothetical protein
VQKWDDSNGDTWDPFWANDGSLYAFNCDGRGFGHRGGRNLAFNELRGNNLSQLSGSMINTMDDYGGAGQKGPDGATWKALGQECIDGVFYAFVSRHTYGSESKDPLMRQTAVNASLIKSTDGGLTWARSAQENYDHPMWPGGRFGTPYFIHYGQNGGAITQDGADRYVYALSNNGFWNNGDDYVLARIGRKKLPDLNAADWSYYTGGDGQSPASWSAHIQDASPILKLPAQCGSGPACYVPDLGAYLMVAWYVFPRLTHWFDPPEMKYDFYQAEHPWGPWTLIRSVSDRFIVGGHMYGPSLCARFQERDGPDVKITMFTAGCPFEDQPAGLYKMWEIPLVLKTRPPVPSSIIDDTDPRITYTGHWAAVKRPGYGYYGDDIHSTTTVNDSLEVQFSGTGIDFISEKYSDLGNVDIYVDGVFKQNVSLHCADFPRFTQVVAFSESGLPAGPHTLKIVNRSTDYAVLDAFRVYGAAGH